MNLQNRPAKVFPTVFCLCCLCLQAAATQQRLGSLRGQVTDELGALVVGATVTLTAADGVQNTAVTNAEGAYTFNSLSPGKYRLKVTAPGFNAYESGEVEVAAGGRTTHDARLLVAIAKQEVTVTDERRLNTDPANNADALVLRGQDLDVLPDDPDALAAAAQAMAGPSADRMGHRSSSMASPAAVCLLKNPFARCA